MNSNAASAIPVSWKIVLFTLLTALGLGPLLTGCVAVAAAGAAGGAVAYVRGELRTDVAHDIEETFPATQRALHKMGFIRIDDRKTSVDAELVSRSALDKKIVVKLEKATTGVTRIKIRVGTFGNHDVSLTVLEEIKAALQ